MLTLRLVTLLTAFLSRWYMQRWTFVLYVSTEMSQNRLYNREAMRDTSKMVSNSFRHPKIQEIRHVVYVSSVCQSRLSQAHYSLALVVESFPRAPIKVVQFPHLKGNRRGSLETGFHCKPDTSFYFHSVHTSSFQIGAERCFSACFSGVVPGEKP